MTVLPVLLFIAGIIFLLLGWRWQNPPSTEILTAMKGLAHLKREINRLEEDLNTLDDKIDNKEQGLTAESPEWRRMETKLLEISKPRDVDLLPEIAKLLRENKIEENRDVNKTARDPRLSAYCNKDTVVAERDGQAFNLMNSGNINNENNWATMPEKYRKVLELAQYNFTVSEISKKFGMSQDTVTMVLRTHQRGGKT